MRGRLEARRGRPDRPVSTAASIPGRARGRAACRDSAPRRVSGFPAPRPRAACLAAASSSVNAAREIASISMPRTGKPRQRQLVDLPVDAAGEQILDQAAGADSSMSGPLDVVAVEFDRLLADRHTAEVVQFAGQPAQLAWRQRVIGDHVADAKGPAADDGSGSGRRLSSSDCSQETSSESLRGFGHRLI